jgi:D-glycero-alpha-D-manno-heptose-7-phosphate kinase
MILVQTPLRISFLGGGTDFPDFFRNHGGCVLTTAIDRYIFVIVKERFDEKIRLGYSTTEMVDDLDELKHDLVRECLRMTGIRRGIEVTTMGDIPSSGSGMGSSSTLTVGLLNALYHYLGEPKDAATLARQACEIELEVLQRPIGVQDQYIAAYGGQRMITFRADGTVDVARLSMSPTAWTLLNRRLMLFYTNRSRAAEAVLAEQQTNIPDRVDALDALKCLAYEGKTALEGGRFDDFGRCLDEGWALKQTLASGIATPELISIYNAAKSAGALGGKVVGAGGGGFLLLYCRPEQQDAVRQALRPLPEMTFNLEPDGSKVIFSQKRTTTWITGPSQPWSLEYNSLSASKETLGASDSGRPRPFDLARA